MNQNSVEDNFVIRFVLGSAVIFLMSVGGGAVGQLFSDLSVPYGAWTGTLVGAIAVLSSSPLSTGATTPPSTRRKSVALL